MVDFSQSAPNPYLVPEGWLTPFLVKAARGLLGWSQRELASQAKIGVSTLADFERGARLTEPLVLRKILRTLNRARVRFVRTRTEIGVFCQR